MDSIDKQINKYGEKLEDLQAEQSLKAARGIPKTIKDL